jgi:hypothetical protein
MLTKHFHVDSDDDDRQPNADRYHDDDSYHPEDNDHYGTGDDHHLAVDDHDLTDRNIDTGFCGDVLGGDGLGERLWV